MQIFAKIYLPFMLVLVIAFPAATQQSPSLLEKSCDPKLQKGLELCLTKLKLDSAAASKSLSIALVDITDPQAAVFSRIIKPIAGRL